MRKNEDENDVVRDGERVVVRTVMMDGVQKVADFRRPVLDSAAHRPGFRTASSPYASDALRAAYFDYDARIQDEWKNPHGGKGDRHGTGTHQLFDSREGQPCVKDGWPGVLVKGPNGELVCQIRQSADALPLKPENQTRNVRGEEEGTEEYEEDSTCPMCGGSGIAPDYDNDDDEDEADRIARQETQTDTGGRHDGMTLDALRKAHAQKLDALYAARDLADAEAWRKG